MVKTPYFHCGGQGFDPWLGNQDPTCHMEQSKKNSKLKLKNQKAEQSGSGDKLHIYISWGNREVAKSHRIALKINVK